jgi:hypothetical protein
LGLARRHSGGLAHTPCRELVAIQPGDDLALLHVVAFIHGAFDETAGGLEADADFGQLDVAGDDQAIAGRLARPTKCVHGRTGGGQNYQEDEDSLFHYCTILRTAPMAWARSMRARL